MPWADLRVNGQEVSATNPIPTSGGGGGGGGGGTEYPEDAAATSGAFGTLALVVRKDTDGSDVSASGDYAWLQTDANGFLKVTCKSVAQLPTTLGQKTAANSLAVVLASDQAALPASQSGTWNVGITGTPAVAQSGAWSVSLTGTPTVNSNSTLQAGSAIVGKVGIDQTTPGTTDSVSVKSVAHTTQVAITRPANVTPYTANDAIGDVGGSAILTFTNMGQAGKDIIITGVEVEIDSATLPTSNGNLQLRLYNAAPTAIADNAPWDLVAGDRSKFLGMISIGTPADLGSTCYVAADNINIQRKLASSSIFGILTTDAGITFAENSTVLEVTLHTMEV